MSNGGKSWNMGLSVTEALLMSTLHCHEKELNMLRKEIVKRKMCHDDDKVRIKEGHEEQCKL